MKRAFLAALLFSAFAAAQALTVTTQVLSNSFCGRPCGRATASASGGLEPYSYAWSNGATDWILEGVVGGTYTITVTDANSEEATDEVEIQALASYGQFLNGLGLRPAYCAGDLPYALVWTGMNDAFTQPAPTSIYGPGPFSFQHSSIVFSGQVSECTDAGSFMYSFLQFDEPVGSSFMVDFQDADGCAGEMFMTIQPPWDPPVFQIVGVGGSCTNGNAGNVAVSVSDGVGKSYRFYVRRADQTAACAMDFQMFSSDGTFADYVHVMDGLAPGDHYLVWTNDWLGAFENNAFVPVVNCEDSVLFNVPEMSGDCGNVVGRLFVDDDADCTADFAENRIPNSVLTVEPGPYYVMTNSQGQFGAALPYGDYTLTEQHPVFAQSCSGTVTISTPADETRNIGCAAGQPLDVQVMAASGPARPGFQLTYGISVDNLTSSATDVVTVTLEVDPLLTFVSSSTEPSSVAGNVLTWTSPGFTMTQPFQHRHLSPKFQIPADPGLIGTTLIASATITTTNADGDLSNNTYTTSVVVTGSFDPNDKVGLTSSRISASEFLIDEDAWIDYTIRFQNTGTDTAFSVLITDTLQAPLDPGSIQMGAASHPYTWSMDLHGTLRVSFANILLPDSNVDEGASHGFVMFRLRPALPLVPGTPIQNIGNIYFDYNPPVITEPSMLVAAMSTDIPERGMPGITVWPNPSDEVLHLSVNDGWQQLFQLDVLALDGRVVLREGAFMLSDVLDTRALPSGAYLIRLQDTDGRMLQAPFVKR